jgi:hypothetical protein
MLLSIQHIYTEDTKSNNPHFEVLKKNVTSQRNGRYGLAKRPIHIDYGMEGHKNWTSSRRYTAKLFYQTCGQGVTLTPHPLLMQRSKIE